MLRPAEEPCRRRTPIRTPTRTPARGTRSATLINNAQAARTSSSDDRGKTHFRDVGWRHLESNMTKQNPALACTALAAALFVAGCATQPDVGQPPETKTL